MLTIYIWQKIISPHRAGLAVALADLGNEVVYVAEKLMSEERSLQGWKPISMNNVRLELVNSEASVRDLVKSAPPCSVHLCGGLRKNGLIGDAQKEIHKRKLQQWVMMETVDDAGAQGFAKRLIYRMIFWKNRRRVSGYLATGYKTSDWIMRRGVAENKVFPFAYFLPEIKLNFPPAERSDKVYRFAFVGRFVALKRLDMLISALADLCSYNFELLVIGSGPLESKLYSMANQALPGRVIWKGRMQMDEVRKELVEIDCLVLPSRYDGWGAVVSEALMSGTPSVCSDTCGSAAAVLSSGAGGTFKSGDKQSLTVLLEDMVLKGRIEDAERERLYKWAACLGAKAGGQYFMDIMSYCADMAARPTPPWER